MNKQEPENRLEALYTQFEDAKQRMNEHAAHARAALAAQEPTMSTNKQPARYAVGEVVRYTTRNVQHLRSSAKILEVFTNGVDWWYVVPVVLAQLGETTMFIGEREIDGLVTPGEM